MSLEIAVIGAGARGQNAYAEYCLKFPNQIQCVAAVDPKHEQLAKIAKKHNIKKNRLFDNEDEFYKQGKICDAVIIANLDKDHFYSIMKCLDLGYNILLEKPITPNKNELEQISNKIREKKAKVMVCYVLRYTPFFKKLKEVVQSKEIGELIGIDHTEYIGNYHMAHSFVRGNWRNSHESSPIILQKTSHDLDILLWLIDSDYKEVYSHGALKYFHQNNAPKDATQKCIDCPYAKQCRYNAQRFYIDPLPEGWSNNVIANPNYDSVTQLLDETNYGSCIYKITDNDVCDHQVALIKFKNDVNVTFTVTAFHQNQSRFIRIMGTEGSIVADTYQNKITITKHVIDSVAEQMITDIYPKNETSGHGGGDHLIMEDFVKLLSTKEYEPLTSYDHAIQSHMMAYDIEESRLSGKVIYR